MKKYLFIPFNAVDAEIFQHEDVGKEFKRRARATSSKCTLFEFDESSRSGLKMLYDVVDGELYDTNGHRIGRI